MFLSVRDGLMLQETDAKDQSRRRKPIVWIVWIWKVAEGLMFEYVFVRVRLNSNCTVSPIRMLKDNKIHTLLSPGSYLATSSSYTSVFSVS